MREIEQRGLYFDEFEEDVKYLHRPGRTVTEADNVLFTTMTMNTQALHLDAAFSEGLPPFHQRLVNSMFTLSTLVGLSVAQLTQGTRTRTFGYGTSGRLSSTTDPLLRATLLERGIPSAASPRPPCPWVARSR